MSGVNLVYLGILAVCVLASGFFSGSETAIIGIQRERVHQLAQRDKRGRKLENLLADPDRTRSSPVASRFRSSTWPGRHGDHGSSPLH